MIFHTTPKIFPNIGVARKNLKKKFANSSESKIVNVSALTKITLQVVRGFKWASNSKLHNTYIKCFSIECRITQTKPITSANQKQGITFESMTNQSRNNSTKARQNAGDQIVTGLSFASDWLRKKREFSRPITHRSKANPNAILDYLRHSIKKIVLYSYEKFLV